LDHELDLADGGEKIMSLKSRIYQKLLILFLLLTLSACPLVFVGMLFFPQAISFLEPVVCPDDMQMEVVSEQGSDRHGSYVMADVFCIGNKQDIDITWKAALIMLGLPTFGVIVYLVMPSPSKNQDEVMIQ
jgi:hypothetical protein